MTANAPIMQNPYGYNTKSLEELHCYLTRSVNNKCFSSAEDLYAARAILELQQCIQGLKQQISSLEQAALATKPQQTLDIIKEKEFSEHERNLDSQRLLYCMEHGVLMVDDCIYENLETETVIDGDFRAALDRLASH